jgi:hypothetical protein
LDSLRFRLQSTSLTNNQISSLYNDPYQDSQGGSKAKNLLQPSLSDIKQEFELERKRNQERILSFLKQKYPDLNEEELVSLMNSTS